MSGQKPSRSGFLKAPLTNLFKGSSKISTQTTPSPSSTSSPSPQPGSVASSIPSSSLNSAAASNVFVVPGTESWWSKNREEIVASVRQVLNVAKETLDGVPVPGLKAAVGGLSESLKLFQTKWGNDESLVEFKEEIERVFAIIHPYMAPDSNVPPEMAERMRKLAKSISGLEQEWVEQTSKHVVLQHLSAELIAEDTKDLTRKLATSITQAMLEGGLRIEATVSDVATTVLNVATTVSNVQTTVTNVQTNVTNVQTTVSNIESKQATEGKAKQDDILQRLAPITSAFHNAANSPSSGCLKDTRVDLLAQIDDWLDEESATRPRVMWLNGLAGTGKSTIARTVAAAARERGILAASFFFSRDHQERRRLAGIVPTIAYQLALWRDELRGPISEAVSENINIADQVMMEQVDTLLIRSFDNKILKNRPSCALLVLDALDECDKEKGTEGGDLLPLLVKSFAKIPFPVKIFVTSRPEHSISMMMNEPELCGPTNVVVLHAVDASMVAADIRLYLTSEFKDVARRRMPRHDQAWPAQDEIDALVTLATPLFVFASTAIKFIDSSAFPPRRQLGIILSSDTARTQTAPFKNLDRLYMNVLLAAIAEEDEVDEICGRFRRVMGAILSVLEPASVTLLSSLLSMDEEEVEYALRPLRAVLDISAHHDPNHVVRIFHPSFPDFVTHPKRCGDHRFFINTRECHAMLAQACLATFTECLSTTQGVSRNRVASSSKLDYARSYWLSHLTSALAPSPSPGPAVSEDIYDSPDAFCLSALMRFLASEHMDSLLHVTSSKISSILRDVTQHSHVAVLYVEGDRCAAAVIPQSNHQPAGCIHLLRFPGITQRVIADIAQTIHRTDLDEVIIGAARVPRNARGYRAVWHLVVEPIFSVLKLEQRAGRDRPRIHWCPLGQTSILPLHAAGVFWKDNRTCNRHTARYVVSSYIPNLATLLALHGAAPAWPASDLRTCLVVHNLLRGYIKHIGAEEEAGLVTSILSQTEGIVTTAHSAQEALDMLASSHIFHYAGPQWWTVGDQKSIDIEFIEGLRISDITRAPLRHPVLAFLSSYTLQSSPALGSAARVLLSGFQSIVTSTGRMYVKDGPVLAEAFYRSWLANARNGLVSLQDIPYALDDACAALRVIDARPIHWAAFVHIGA